MMDLSFSRSSGEGGECSPAGTFPVVNSDDKIEFTYLHKFRSFTVNSKDENINDYLFSESVRDFRCGLS